MPEDPTFIELVAKRIKSQATHFDPGDETGPTIILWPDENREWEPILPLLRKRLPILTWGPYDKEERCGPAVWIRCMVSSVLPEKFAPNTIPIVYLLEFQGYVDVRKTIGRTGAVNRNDFYRGLLDRSGWNMLVRISVFSR
jgi:hypothetical protein